MGNNSGGGKGVKTNAIGRTVVVLFLKDGIRKVDRDRVLGVEKIGRPGATSVVGCWCSK
jgi:hypothetical protein